MTLSPVQPPSRKRVYTLDWRAVFSLTDPTQEEIDACKEAKGLENAGWISGGTPTWNASGTIFTHKFKYNVALFVIIFCLFYLQLTFSNCAGVG